jgi:hypothetical protein
VHLPVTHRSRLQSTTHLLWDDHYFQFYPHGQCIAALPEKKIWRGISPQIGCATLALSNLPLSLQRVHVSRQCLPLLRNFPQGSWAPSLSEESIQNHLGSCLMGFPNSDSYIKGLEYSIQAFSSEDSGLLLVSSHHSPPYHIPMPRQLFLRHSKPWVGTHMWQHPALSRWFSNCSCWHRRSWYDVESTLEGQELQIDITFFQHPLCSSPPLDLVICTSWVWVLLMFVLPGFSALPGTGAWWAFVDMSWSNPSENQKKILCR